MNQIDSNDEKIIWRCNEMKVYLDPGHGGADPGAIGNGIKEKDITLDITQRIRAHLTQHDIEVRMSRTKDITKSLNQRTNEANTWGADYFISIHCNAFNGKARGYEDYIYTRANTTTTKFRNVLHEEIAKTSGLPNRGKKRANFHVLRETAMPAFLSENGFIDHKKDADLMKSSVWREQIALAHARGILKALNMRKIEPAADQNLYRVIAGSFQSKERAARHVQQLQSKKIPAWIQPTINSGKTWYRVQVGAFSTLQAAEKWRKTIEGLGLEVIILHSK